MVSIALVFLLLLVPMPSSEEKCTSPLLALMQMASGVDITSLDLFPNGNASESRGGLLENVFNFTCSGVKIGQKLEYTNHTGDNFVNYDLPDQITDIDVWPIIDSGLSIYSGKVHINLDWSAVMRTLLYRIGSERDTDSDRTLAFGSFARSAKYTSVLKQYFGSNKAFYHIDNPRSSKLGPYIDPIDRQYKGNGTRVKQSILSHNFLDYVNHKLPPKYEDNPSAYETFIGRFGTHYFARLFISDYDYVQFALSQDYVLDNSDDQMADNMAAAYRKYFKSWLNNTYSKHSSNSNSDIILAYRNGSVRWVDKLTGAQYQSVQFTGPSIRTVELGSIEELIDNQTIQSQVWIAIQMHRIRAQLEALNNIYAFTSDYYQLSSEEKVVLENVTKSLNSRDIKQIYEMIAKLDDLYNKVRKVRDKHFLTPVIDDFYVIAAARLEFAKQICTASLKRYLKGHWSTAPDWKVADCEREMDFLYEQYHSSDSDYFLSGYKSALEDARRLNQRHGLRADMTNGLRATCE